MQSFISIPGIKTLTVMEWRQHALLLMVRMCLSKSRFFFCSFVCSLRWRCLLHVKMCFVAFGPFFSFFFFFFCVALCFPTSDASLCVHNFLFLFVQLVPFNVRFFIYLPDVHHGTAKSRFEFFFLFPRCTVFLFKFSIPLTSISPSELFFFFFT